MSSPSTTAAVQRRRILHQPFFPEDSQPPPLPLPHRCHHHHHHHPPPKLQMPSQTSSEFLYLGTLVNSHASGGNIPYNGSISAPADNRTSNPRKMDSPELRPLPPLNAA